MSVTVKYRITEIRPYANHGAPLPKPGEPPDTGTPTHAQIRLQTIDKPCRGPGLMWLQNVELADAAAFKVGATATVTINAG